MRKLSKKQRIYVYTFCADMIKADLPLYDSILKLKNEGEKILGRGFIKKLDFLLNRMKHSESISLALEPLIPKDDLSLIYSSEQSGALGEGFVSLVNIITYKDALTSKIKKTLIFPLIMMCLSLIVIAGYATEVFPAFERVVPVSKWPGITSSLYEFGKALVAGLWIEIAIGAILFYYFVMFLLANTSGPIRDNILDKVLPFSIYKQLNSAILISSLSSMLKNNIPIQDSLQIISLNANRWLLSHINRMKSNMSKGLNYGEALDTGLLNKEILLNISLYSALPSFYDILVSVSTKTQEMINKKIDVLSGGLKSFATLVLGCTVIWVFGALFSLSDQLSRTM